MNVRELIAELIKLPMDVELRNTDGIPVCNINTSYTAADAAYIFFDYPEGYIRNREIKRVAELAGITFKEAEEVFNKYDDLPESSSNPAIKPILEPIKMEFTEDQKQYLTNRKKQDEVKEREERLREQRLNNFYSSSTSTTTWRYETVADSKVRKYLKEHRNMSDLEVDQHLQSFHIIGGIRAQLDILPGEPS